MTRLLLAMAALIASALPAHANVIFTPLFTLLLTSFEVSATAIAFGTVTWVSLLSGLATIALGIGLTILTTPKPPRPEDGHIPVQQPIAAVVYGYGRARIAGAIVLKEARNNVLYQITALTGHEIIGNFEYWLNDDKVTVDGTGAVQALGDGRYNDAIVHLQTRTGLATETAYPFAVSSLPGIWTNDHRGDGCASLFMYVFPCAADQMSTRLPYGPPQASVAADMVRVFDPRDPAQAWDDPTTWSDSGYDNPAICLIHFECFSEFGPGRSYEEAIFPILDDWIAEADICDELVPQKAGGTEKRYRMGGWTDTEKTDVRGTRSQILQSCDGFFVERGDGTIRLWVGKYRAPTVEITDDDIVGWSWQSGLPDSDRYEWITARYTSVANGYSTVDTDNVPLDNGALAASKNRIAPLELPWVQSTGQASRLLRREKSRYEEPVRGQLTMRLSGLNALYERWIYVNSSIPRLQGVVIENKGPKISLTDGKTIFEFVSSGAHVDTYDATTDESRPPLTVTRPGNAALVVPAILSAVAEETIASPSSVVVIKVTIETPTYDTGEPIYNLTFAVRWAIDTASPVWSTKVINEYTEASGTITLSTDPVSPNSVYLVQVSVSSGTLIFGSSSAVWSSSASVDTTTDGIAPASPTILSATGGSAAVLSVQAPNSATVAAVRIWRNLTGDGFSGSSDVSGALYCSPNQIIEFTDSSVSTGDWDYWATAENSSGTLSTQDGPATVTIT